MYAHLTITNSLQRNSVYVALDFSKGNLVITRPRGFYQEEMCEIPINEMSYLEINDFLGVPVISFYHNQVRYQLYSTGLAVVEYLQEHLMAVAS